MLPAMRFLASAALLFLAFTAGCSGLPRTIENPEERLEMDGGSVGVPGVGWQLTVENPAGLVFVTGDEEAQRAWFATAGATDRLGSFADLATLRDFLTHESEKAEGVERVAFQVVDGAVDGEVDASHSKDDRETVTRVHTRTYALSDGRQLIVSVTQVAPPESGRVDLTPEARAFLRGFEPRQ